MGNDIDNGLNNLKTELKKFFKIFYLFSFSLKNISFLFELEDLIHC